MIELNNVKALAAWEDYRAHLIDVGTLRELQPGKINPVEMAREKAIQVMIKTAFKQGYFMAQLVEKEEPITVEAPIKKRQRSRTRTEREMNNDARMVASILERSKEPMSLSEIVDALNASGGNWYKRSGTSHMEKVMDKYPAIKKVARGVYEYEQ